jgi:hypothetical protein
MMHNTAQGLASLGRGNDSMLMHVTPNEVAGLQSIAMAHGGSLTINPQTGLPEAGFFDFVGSMLPVAASMMFPTFAPGFIAPGVAAGALTGAAIAAISGKDPLMGGLTGGFGGYSGAQLAKGFTAAGAPAAATEVAKDAAASTTVGGVGNTGMFTAGNVGTPGVGPQSIFGGASEYGQTAANLSGPGPNPYAGGYAGEPTYAASSGFGSELNTIGKGIKNTLGLGEIPQADAWKAATEAAPNMGSNLALTGASAGLAALEPSGDQFKPEEDKYNPYATLNLSGDTGLRLYAAGGDVYTNQSSIASGGLQSLYGSSDSSGGRQPLSRDGYGIGRLENLTAEGSRAKAADTFYAQGGYLDGAGDGMSDSIPATIEGRQPARLADGEFVVPADVVSHLGNGSSKAGSKRLYKMLDKVRHARTGNKKQGKQIKADKYLPV